MAMGLPVFHGNPGPVVAQELNGMEIAIGLDVHSATRSVMEDCEKQGNKRSSQGNCPPDPTWTCVRSDPRV